jgi:hypothetical protein
MYHIAKRLVLAACLTVCLADTQAQEKPNEKSSEKIIRTQIGRVTLDIPFEYVASKNIANTEKMTLLLQWPSLKPYPEQTQINLAAKIPEDAVFIILEQAADLDPDDRLRQLYPRYLETDRRMIGESLQEQAFKPGSPHEDETLITSLDTPPTFHARCPINRDTRLPTTCLSNFRFAASVDVQLRFARTQLNNGPELSKAARRLMTLWLKQENPRLQN